VQNVVYTQSSLEDKEQKVLLDPNTLSEDGTVALMGTVFSEDGKFLAYSLGRYRLFGFDIWFMVFLICVYSCCFDIETPRKVPDVGIQTEDGIVALRGNIFDKLSRSWPSKFGSALHLHFLGLLTFFDK